MPYRGNVALNRRPVKRADALITDSGAESARSTGPTPEPPLSRSAREAYSRVIKDFRRYRVGTAKEHKPLTYGMFATMDAGAEYLQRG